MRDFKVLRQRHITRRFQRILALVAPVPGTIPIEIDEIDVLLDLDPAAAYGALSG